MRILSIIGTRPEAVKMSPVIRELKTRPGVEIIICVTAQHRQMLDQVLSLFNITPDIDLNLMRPGQSLAEITAAIFTHLDPFLKAIKPDWVLAQGDTTTVMAAAVLSYYNRHKFGHVEAGLRTGDKWQPFPEELNRIIAGAAADLHFAPTSSARANLLRENIAPGKIVVTGNPVIDALQWVADQPATGSVHELFTQAGITLAGKKSGEPKLILVTAHRRENFGKPIENICMALRRIAEHYKDSVRIIYPVHLNPNVQEPVYRLLSDMPNITLLPPVDYLTVVNLLKRAYLVLTDSGGMQEEAPSFGVPVLVLRDVTERPEAVEMGTVQLAGTDPERIFRLTQNLLEESTDYETMVHAVNPYGDGQAAKRIALAILGEPFDPFQPH